MEWNFLRKYGFFSYEAPPGFKPDEDVVAPVESVSGDKDLASNVTPAVHSARSVGVMSVFLVLSFCKA